MTVGWPMVRLGDVLRRSEEIVTPDLTTEYSEITVRLWGKGVTERGRVLGSEVNGRRYAARRNQFIASRIDARNGAMGVVPAALDGALVTNDFPLFNVCDDRLLVQFLGWLCRTPGFVDLCLRASEGTTNRVRLKEQSFLSLEVPLPPLHEQRRIVGRIEELAGEIEAARRLRAEAVEETEAVIAGEELNIWPADGLGSAIPLDRVTSFLARGRQSEQGDSEHFLIKTQHVQMDRCIPTYLRLAPHVAAKVDDAAVVQDGDILIACSAAGCLGRVARYIGDGRVASTDTHVAIARPNADAINPDYLYAYLRGAQGQFQLRSRERGDWQREKISFRLTELNLNDLRQVPVPVPHPLEQRRIVREIALLRAEMGTLQMAQGETGREIDALLSSVLDRAFRGEL